MEARQPRPLPPTPRDISVARSMGLIPDDLGVENLLALSRCNEGPSTLLPAISRSDGSELSRGCSIQNSAQEIPTIEVAPEYDARIPSPGEEHVKRDLLVEMLLTAMSSEELSPSERIALVSDCKALAKALRVKIPFREMLGDLMEHLAPAALLDELTTCQPDWDGINYPDLGSGLEKVFYLIESCNNCVPAPRRMRVLMNVLRRGCLRRFDEYEGNRLFQCLRPIILESQRTEAAQTSDYDVSITPLSSFRGNVPGTQPSYLDFHAFIGLPHFASRVMQPEAAEPMNQKPPQFVASRHIAVEFLAARRAWRLKVDSNALQLELLDGPGGSIPRNFGERSELFVDARVEIIPPGNEHIEQDSNFIIASNARNSSSLCESQSNAAIELLFQPTLLRPPAVEGPGITGVKLSPCFCPCPSDGSAFRGLDDARLLHDGQGTLLLEMTVRFAHNPF